MSIESIAALGVGTATPELSRTSALPELGRPTAALPESSASAGTFQSMLSTLTELNQELHAGERNLQKVALGGGLDNLHQTVMGMERTRLTLQLLLQVRSRALDAYSELTRMQI
jgi:flagellar hook-basal body complex protein FliE